jgi:Cytochrome P460
LNLIVETVFLKDKEELMKRVAFWLVRIAAVAGVLTPMSLASGQAHEQAPPVYVTKMPPGYRDWTVISVAHKAGNISTLGAKLGNDVAIRAYREGKLPFPDGTIIAAVHWTNSPSDENNKVFGRDQSFVPGPATNTQFMIKDSKKYATTGGWGFGHFNKDGTLGNDALMKTCPLSRQGFARPGLHAIRTLMDRFGAEGGASHFLV